MSGAGGGREGADPDDLAPEARPFVRRLSEASALGPSDAALHAAIDLLNLLGARPLVPPALGPGAAAAVAAGVWRSLAALSSICVEPRMRHELMLHRRTANDLRGAAGDSAVLSRVPEGAGGSVGLALAPLESAPSLGAALASLSPEDRMLCAVSWLADPVVLTPAQAAGRDWLIEHADLLEAGNFPLRFGARIASAWMFCSYADHPRRHAVKRALNRTIVRWLERAGIRPDPEAMAAGRSRGPGPAWRPTVFVVAERFRRNHAMFRCYAPSIAQLRDRCRVVILGQEAHLDDGARELADEVWTVAPSLRELPALVRRIQAANPDAIFYPSVGMSFWAIALANLRLAPLQFMSIGHPASSFSEQMDAIVLGADVLGDPVCFSEAVIVREAPGNPIHPPLEPWGIVPPPRERPDLLEIAVPAMAAKLSPAFVAACRRLAREAGRPVRFHFFPNRSGVTTRHLEVVLRHQLRDVARVAVYPPVPYPRYMAWLARCDLALATFPFGNANSTVDCLLLGKPVVALEGDEPAARTDRRMLRLAGAPSWLLATTREGYFEAALRLIRDDALRVETARSILAADPPRALFERERERHPDDFAEVVGWMLDNVDRIRNEDRKVWWPADRRGAAARME